METYIKKAEDLDAVNANFIPPLLDAILGDYSRNVPAARDAEVLNVMSTITGRLAVSALHCFEICNVLNYSSAPLDAASPRHLGCRVRANVEYDQPRFRGIP
jgi:hypothetical protein